MKQTPSKPQHPHETSLKLECPYCAAEIGVTESHLIDGASVLCEHCNEESLLSRERIEHTQTDQWTLVEPGDNDEP